jgi:hypothetical protein
VALLQADSLGHGTGTLCQGHQAPLPRALCQSSKKRSFRKMDFILFVKSIGQKVDKILISAMPYVPQNTCGTQGRKYCRNNIDACLNENGYCPNANKTTGPCRIISVKSDNEFTGICVKITSTTTECIRSFAQCLVQLAKAYFGHWTRIKSTYSVLFHHKL